MSSQQRADLEHLVAATSHKACILAPTRLLLLADHASTDPQIVAPLCLGPATVLRTRKRSVESGWQLALYDLPRSGRLPLLVRDVEAN